MIWTISTSRTLFRSIVITVLILIVLLPSLNHAINAECATEEEAKQGKCYPQISHQSSSYPLSSSIIQIVNHTPIVEYLLPDIRYFIVLDLTNQESKQLEFVYLVQIEDSEGIPVHLKIASGSIEAKDRIRASADWVPLEIGNYRIETFVWSDLNTPVPLVPSKHIDAIVASTKGHPADLNVIIPKGMGESEWLNATATFQPHVLKVMLGVNNTVRWINLSNKALPLESDNTFTSNSFKTFLKPGESFSFTFDKAGEYGYSALNWWERGKVIVTTPDIESSNLRPSELTAAIAHERALLLTVAMDDQILEKRLDSATDIAYTTAKGDIITSKYPIMEEWRVAHYSVQTRLNQFDEKEAMDFTKSFLRKAGIELIGSEWIESVNFGDRIEIRIQPRNHGWIIQNSLIIFNYYKDRLTLEIGKWYNDVWKKELVLSQDNAREVAKMFMDAEIRDSDSLRKYNYTSGKTGWVTMQIVDDKLMYVVAVGYQADERFEGYHCPLTAFLVYVDPVNGLPFGWRFPACE